MGMDSASVDSRAVGVSDEKCALDSSAMGREGERDDWLGDRERERDCEGEVWDAQLGEQAWRGEEDSG
jgi:hypothetical protein